MSIGILDLLRLEHFDAAPRRFKLVRHQQGGVPLEDFLRRRDWFETYQSFQRRPVFDDIDFIISFMGIGGTRARLIGVYRVLGRKGGDKGRLPKGFPSKYQSWLSPHYFFYQLQKVEGFEELERRVVIEWGPGTRTWVQWPTNKEVTELRPKGQWLQPFDDYLSFTLTYSELQDLCSNPAANAEWRARLSAVAGVYLILATTTGAQYVGSAYGTEGFWGRWSAYARNGHGGNKLLRELIRDDTSYPAAFSYSILQTVSTTTAIPEVLRHEAMYKKKLGSRAKLLSDDLLGGLNAN